MTRRGKAIVIDQDDVDTDVLYPGKYLNVLDPEQAREHLFEGLDPALRALLKHGPTVLFVGNNFGSGSSREQPATAMVASGVGAVIGKSFARIFARNAVNCGMPALVNPAAVGAVRPGCDVEVDVVSGTVRIGGTDYPSRPLAPLPHAIVMAGGLVPWIKAGAGRGVSSNPAGRSSSVADH